MAESCQQDFEVNFEDKNVDDGAEKDRMHASKVMESLQRIYKERKLCDVSLVIGEKAIPAHRLVLAANSNYFYTMFTSDLAESSTSQIVLKEVDFEAVELLVEYSYSSIIIVNSSNVESLLRTSHFLQFNSVVDICCGFMRSQLDPTNCLGVSNIAELHSCDELRDFAMKFAMKHFTKVGQTDEFLRAPLAQIIELLVSDTLNVSSEKDAFDIALTWVKHDVTSREKYLPEILQNIRLPLMSPKVLVDTIENNDLVAANNVCLQTVSEAKNYHLLPERMEEFDDVRKRPRVQDGGKCLYIIGGEIHSYVFNTLDCYNFDDDSWSLLSCLQNPRDGLGVATYNGCIFAAGGCDGDSALNSVECYDPKMDTWSMVSPMTKPRHAFSLVELNGWLYSAGGSDFANSEYSSVERYDPVRDSWFDITPMSVKREGLETVPLNGCLYCVGGDNGTSILNSMEQYDPRVGDWVVCMPMNYRRRYFGSAVLQNQIIVLGGSDSDEDHNSVECYETKMNRWMSLPPLLVRRESPVAAVVQDCLFAIGGSFMNVETNSIDVYSPRENKWEPFTPMPRAMEGMGLAVL